MPTHDERRVLGYSPAQLYDLVADVEHYPDFLPWCIAARIRKREPNLLVADLIIGFRMIRERFTSRVELDPAGKEIHVTYAEGPFKYLNNHWRFLPHPEGCEIEFYVDFEFRSRMLQKMMQALFHEAVRRMVGAFETRANELYGPPGGLAPPR
ncbi:MAG: type II toxin-antitoxin system RatA family toxin [Pseudomonadota bacterium]